MGGAGQVRPVLLLPGIQLGLGQRRRRGVVQPGMPLRRHGRRLLAPGEQDPAAWPVINWLAGTALEINIAETVGADLAPAQGRGEAKQKGHGAGRAPRGWPRSAAQLHSVCCGAKSGAEGPCAMGPPTASCDSGGMDSPNLASPVATGVLASALWHASLERCGMGFRCVGGARAPTPMPP